MPLEQYENRIVISRGKGTIAFELQEPDSFYMTGYKVISNFNGDGLIPVYKSLLNGKIRLIYDLKDYVPLVSVIDGISSERFLTLLQSLFSLCERIKENGFIQGEHVCLEEDMIFADESVSQIWLVYVPLKQRNSMTVEADSLERQLVKFLSGMMTAYPALFDSRINPLREYVDSGKCDITHMLKLLYTAAQQQPVSDTSASAAAPDVPAMPDSLILERVGGTQRLLLRIPSQGAVIGRNEELSQVLISDPSVSKKHCMIRKTDGKWMIEDLKSSNHTWIGDSSEYLAPYTACEIHPGDTIRISRFVFQVKTGIGD